MMTIFSSIYIIIIPAFTLVPILAQQNSDPRDLDLLRRFPGNCSSDNFDCGDKCILKTQFRDCVEDCQNGIDEACWTGSIKCDGCRCVDPKDANRLCLDRNQNTNKLCTINGHYVCANKQCVLGNWVADGRNDCGDWSDENPCLNGANPCPAQPGVVCRFIKPNGFQCTCSAAGVIFNGAACVPGTTTVATTTPTTIAPTINPPMARKCQLSPMSRVQPTAPTSLAIVFDTKQSMIPDRGFLVDMLLQTWFNTTVTEPRITNFVLVPYGPKLGAIVIAHTMLQMYDAVQQLSGTSHDCPDPAMSALTAALNSVQANSVMFLFTDGVVSDAGAIDGLLQAVASSSKFTRMTFVTSGTCPNVNRTVAEAFDKVATATGGEVLRLTKVATEYNSILQYTRRQLKQNFTMVDMVHTNDRGTLVVPTDAGMDELIISATGNNVALQVNASNSYRYLVQLPNVKTLTFPTPAPETISATATASGPLGLTISAVGLPSLSVALSPNPLLPNAEIGGPVVFGSPIQAIISATAVGAPGKTFPLLTMIAKEIDTGAVLYQGNLKVNRTDSTGRDVYYSGKIFPTCRPFVIHVFGTNECNERFQRMSSAVFQAVAKSTPLRGACGEGRVQCSTGLCISESVLLDFRADCSDGTDEARPMDEYQCSTNCSTCSNGGAPGSTGWCSRPNTFRCANGVCIPMSWVNDGFDDCGDGSDEKPPTGQASTSRPPPPPPPPPSSPPPQTPSPPPPPPSTTTTTLTPVTKVTVKETVPPLPTTTTMAAPAPAPSTTTAAPAPAPSTTTAAPAPAPSTTTAAPAPAPSTVTTVSTTTSTTATTSITTTASSTVAATTSTAASTAVPTTLNYYPSTLQPPPQMTTEEVFRRIYNNTCGPPGRYFQCTDATCILVEKFRDCQFNCKDGSDEVCPNSLTKCQSCKCAEPASANTQCADTQIREICSRSSMYPCRAPNYCTRLVDLLNGVQNCPDNSDEDPTYLDQCYLGLAHCDRHAYCKTIPSGGFECVCVFGFQGNGTYCDVPHNRRRRRVGQHP